MIKLLMMFLKDWRLHFFFKWIREKKNSSVKYSIEIVLIARLDFF